MVRPFVSLRRRARSCMDGQRIRSLRSADALAKRAFQHLEGVTDDWIKTVKVEKIPGGQIDPNGDLRLYAELILREGQDACCARKMYDQPDQEAPNLADPDTSCHNKQMIAAQK